MTETLQSVLHHTLVSRWAGCATEEKLYAKGLELVGLMKSPKDFTPIGWGKIRAALQAQGNASSSINNKLSVWRCLAQSAVEMGLIQAVPRVKKERQQENPERWLDYAEQDTLFGYMKPWAREVSLVLVGTGLRVGELFALTWDDVDFERRRLHIYNTKNGKQRFVPFGPAVEAVLHSLQDRGEPSPSTDKAVRTYEQLFLEARRKSGLKGRVTVHTLRHTFASRLVQSGVDLYRVGTLLGHTTLATTARYAHLSDESLVESVLQIER
jgi:integrase